MTWRHAGSWILALAICACARGVAGTRGLPDTGVGNTGGNADSGADAMTPMDSGAMDAGNSKDAGAKDAGVDAGMACTAMNMCSSARMIPDVAGDTGGDSQTVMGMKGEWLNVHVSDTFLTGSQLKALFTLTSSEGANYDLFVLKPADSGGAVTPPVDCAATLKSSINTSTTDSLSFVWSDGTNAGGQSAGDGLILSIEVRHVSGPCGSWSLTVEGNK